MTTTIEQEFARRVLAPSDINEHLETLRKMAAQCTAVAEFGVRTGNSTVALLAGLAAGGGGVLHSFDLNPAQVEPPSDPRYRWIFTQADTSKLDRLPSVEMLFIDTLHTREQVEAELAHAKMVTKWLVFHDTTLCGWDDEHYGKGGGINRAIFEFLLTTVGLHWRVQAHYPNNNGLLVLRRT